MWKRVNEVKIEFENLEFHIKELLEKKNMSLKELSVKTGINYSNLSNIANSRNTNVTLPNMLRICYILWTTLDKLISPFGITSKHMK